MLGVMGSYWFDLTFCFSIRISIVANFCELAGGDVKEVARGLGYDSRIGSRFLYAGIGYGGSCFPKDVKAFIRTGQAFNSPFRLLETVDEVNALQRLRPFMKLQDLWGEDMQGKTVAVWGLAFKPRTDDVREAAALLNIASLLGAGAKVRAFDPVAMENAAQALSGKKLVYTKKAVDAVRGADALIIATEWDEFRVLDFADLKKRMKGNIIYDGRNVLERSEAEAAGFVYYGIGV